VPQPDRDEPGMHIVHPSGTQGRGSLPFPVIVPRFENVVFLKGSGRTSDNQSWHSGLSGRHAMPTTFESVDLKAFQRIAERAAFSALPLSHLLTGRLSILEHETRFELAPGRSLIADRSYTQPTAAPPLS
jgi:hypothetical protein